VPDRKSAKLAVAVCVNVSIKANSKETIDFALVWNMPKIYFDGKSEKWLKRFSFYY
jgi:hypothetical protein